LIALFLAVAFPLRSKVPIPIPPLYSLLAWSEDLCMIGRVHVME